MSLVAKRQTDVGVALCPERIACRPDFSSPARYLGLSFLE
jgi:hypothetical protein